MKFLLIIPISLILVLLAFLGFHYLIQQPLAEIKKVPYEADFEFVDLEIEETINTRYCGKERSYSTQTKTYKTHYLNGITIEKHQSSENDMTSKL